MNLGENIYRFRTQQNMSQGDLADALEVSRQSVSKWENNSAVPELDKLMKMAQIFGITLDELVTGEEKAQPTVLPQATPAAPPTQSQAFHGRYTVGMLLLAFGILSCLLFTILEFLFGNCLWGIFIGAVMIACGICCWTIERHTALACGWIVYLAVYSYATIISGGLSILLPTTGGAVTIMLLAFGAALTTGTLVKLWKGQITNSLPLKILLTVLLAAMMSISVILVSSTCVDIVQPAVQPSTSSPGGMWPSVSEVG